MTFTDLPADWRDDLDAVDLADVVDLFTSASDRDHGVLVVLLADHRHRLLVPMVVSDVPATCGSPDRRDFATHVGRVAEHLPDVGAAALAIGRRGPLLPRRSDLEWQYWFARMLRDRDLDDLGCCVATEHGVVRLQRGDVAAA